MTTSILIIVLVSCAVVCSFSSSSFTIIKTRKLKYIVQCSYTILDYLPPLYIVNIRPSYTPSPGLGFIKKKLYISRQTWIRVSLHLLNQPAKHFFFHLKNSLTLTNLEQWAIFGKLITLNIFIFNRNKTGNERH